LSVVFFADRDLGNRFPDILSSAGLRVERHRDHFRPASTDEEWLAAVGARGWVAVTHDSRIRYKPNELQAVVRHQARSWREISSQLSRGLIAFSRAMVRH